MIRCPFCHFNNEDGALFCEQCKSDLAGALPEAAPVHAAPALPMAQTLTLEALPTATPVLAEEAAPELVQPLPLAHPDHDDLPVAHALPVEAMPVAHPDHDDLPVAHALPV